MRYSNLGLPECSKRLCSRGFATKAAHSSLCSLSNAGEIGATFLAATSVWAPSGAGPCSRLLRPLWAAFSRSLSLLVPVSAPTSRRKAMGPKYEMTGRRGRDGEHL